MNAIEIKLLIPNYGTGINISNSARIPVTLLTRSGGHWLRVAFKRSKPTVCTVLNEWRIASYPMRNSTRILGFELITIENQSLN